MSNNQNANAEHNQRIKNTLSKKSFGYFDACAYTDDEESPLLELLNYFEEVTRKLPEHHLPMFRLVPSRDQCGQYILKRGFNVDRILKLLELIPQLQYQCPDHEFNPYVECFLHSAYLNHVEGIKIYKFTNQEAIDRLNDFVDDVINEICSPEFRLKQRRCREKTDKNARGLDRYIDALFKRYPKLLVIRVDFGYQKRRLSDPYYELEPLDVLDDKERLIRYAKRLLGDSLVGHAWKLEHGILKSYHYHMVFFVNGRERRGDFYIGRQLGEYWVDVITQGLGTTFNCNAKKNEFSELAIGMVHRDEDQKRKYLNKHVVSYLTKNDDSMRLKIKACGKQIRTFGKGDMPAEREGVRRGRPRD